MYGHHYTTQTMSNMTKVLIEEVNAFKVRALNDKYVAIFMDATYIPLKRQIVSKEAIYIAMGIREDGTKEVLSYAIAPTVNRPTFGMSCYSIFAPEEFKMSCFLLRMA